MEILQTTPQLPLAGLGTPAMAPGKTPATLPSAGESPFAALLQQMGLTAMVFPQAVPADPAPVQTGKAAPPEGTDTAGESEKDTPKAQAEAASPSVPSLPQAPLMVLAVPPAPATVASPLTANPEETVVAGVAAPAQVQTEQLQPQAAPAQGVTASQLPSSIGDALTPPGPVENRAGSVKATNGPDSTGLAPSFSATAKDPARPAPAAIPAKAIAEVPATVQLQPPVDTMPIPVPQRPELAGTETVTVKGNATEGPLPADLSASSDSPSAGPIHQVRPILEKEPPQKVVEGNIPGKAMEALPQAEIAEAASPRVLSKVDVVFKEAPGGEQQSLDNAPGKTMDEKGKPFYLHPAVAESPKTFTVAEPAAKAENSGQLAETVLSQVKDAIPVHDGKGNSHITVTLKPAELGELKIQVSMQDQRVKVEVMAENRHVKDVLMGNLDSLKETLLKQNLTMERFDVSTGGSSSYFFQQPSGEERWVPQNQSYRKFATAMGQTDREETSVSYLTTNSNALVDVRF